jgi:hypothetical protein
MRLNNPSRRRHRQPFGAGLFFRAAKRERPTRPAVRPFVDEVERFVG